MLLVPWLISRHSDECERRAEPPLSESPVAVDAPWSLRLGPPRASAPSACTTGCESTRGQWHRVRRHWPQTPPTSQYGSGNSYGLLSLSPWNRFARTRRDPTASSSFPSAGY